jgi:hypothetical protein
MKAMSSKASRPAAVLTLLVLTATARAQSPAPQTTWINDHGSELVIQSIAADGRLTGTYSSSAPNFKCRNIAFPAVGWVDGDRIAYTVQWKNANVDCNQITSWTGFARTGRIFVEWSLVYFDAIEGRQSLSRGFDQYKPK